MSFEQGRICETRKGPNRPQIRIFPILKIILPKFSQPPGVNLTQTVKNTHQHIQTFHLKLQPSLYDHPIESYSPYKLMFRKNAVLGVFWPNSTNFRRRIRSKLPTGTSTRLKKCREVTKVKVANRPAQSHELFKMKIAN